MLENNYAEFSKSMQAFQIVQVLWQCMHFNHAQQNVKKKTSCYPVLRLNTLAISWRHGSSLTAS